MKAVELLADGSRGIYVPNHFAEFHAADWQNLDDDALRILNYGPDHEDYLDAWDDTERNAYYKEGEYTWRLYHSEHGDLFAVCDDLMTKQEYSDFFGG